MTALSWSLVALLVLAGVLNYVDRQALAALGPTIKAEFHLSSTDWGWINSAFAAVYIASSILGGMWIDKVGVRKGLLISTIVWSLAAAGHAFAHDFWSLCFWRMMLAIGEGPGNASLLKGIRRLMTPKLRDTGASMIGAGWAAGSLLAPIFAGLVAEAYGWQGAFMATGGLSLMWLPFWIALAFRAKVPLGKERVALAAANDRAPDPISWRSFGVWATLIAILSAVPPTVFTNSFLSLYFNQTWQLSQAQVTRILWQPFLAADVGMLTGGFATLLLFRSGWSFLRARTLVIGCGLVGAAVIALAAAAPNLDQALWLINVSRFLFSGGYAVLAAYGIESVTEKQTGAMSGLMNATFSVCNFIFAPLIGRMVDVTGNYNAVLVMVAVFPVLGFAAWVWLSRAAHRQGAAKA
ncbi:MAG: hypothetical protein RIQ93_1840 [Verrucomicrobiota bacterium]|jgi:ACS family hexuronate transporter-like MFS transporter